jgi:pyruvate/2-oxoglutarate dehydrogenase complex dihydrolipoamide dehydrogenase (E3) component/uncharacterized membrane protein YdjX (TVP38/TMEM64 family)
MKKLIKFLILLTLGFVFIFLFKEYGHLLTLESLQSQKENLQNLRNQKPGVFEFYFLLIYIVSTALSIPGATVLTLAAGALFGLVWGTVLVSVASTTGATLSFLLTRYLFRDWVKSKFSEAYNKMESGFSKEGAAYLFSLRLIPLFPFFAVNAVMGLTPISVSKFFFISQLGMLPGTVIYVWAGLEVSQLQSLSGILSPGLISAFVALGLLPWFMKRLLKSYQSSLVYKKFKKPKKFDYNLVVIGAGAAGLVSTAIARAVKARVAIIEKHKMGGDCLNYGCVPSKALIHFAKNSKNLNYSEIQSRIQAIIKKIEPHDSVERFKKLGAEVILGQAKIISPWEVQVGEQTLTTRSIIVATGAEPFIPSIPGLHNVQVVTSETLWDLKNLPKNLLIVGGGPIGCEMAQSFARLGVKVTLVEKGPRLLISEIKEVSQIIENSLAKDGVQLFVNSEIIEFQSSSNALVKINDLKQVLSFDVVLFAIGRKPRTKGFGLEDLGVSITQKGTLEHNEFMQTNFPNIFVCGDVAGPYQLTHAAGHQAWYASVNALFGKFKMFKQDLRVLPRCTFTSPEVASVGLNPLQAEAQGLEVDVTHYLMDDFDRAICDEETQGFIQIVTKKNSDRILGVTIVSDRAGELLAEYTLALRWNLGLKKILSTVHAYPTWSDANKLAALEWQRKNIPHKLLDWVEKYHSMMRN